MVFGLSMLRQAFRRRYGDVDGGKCKPLSDLDTIRFPGEQSSVTTNLKFCSLCSNDRTSEAK